MWGEMGKQAKKENAPSGRVLCSRSRGNGGRGAGIGCRVLLYHYRITRHHHTTNCANRHQAEQGDKTFFAERSHRKTSLFIARNYRVFLYHATVHSCVPSGLLMFTSQIDILRNFLATF